MEGNGNSVLAGDSGWKVIGEVPHIEIAGVAHIHLSSMSHITGVSKEHGISLGYGCMTQLIELIKTNLL